MAMEKDERLRAGTIIIGIIILLAIHVWSNFPAMAQTEKTPRGGTLKMINEEPPHLNLALLSGATAVPACQIFIGLLQFDENYQPKPYLAKKWEMSPDGLSYTFHLERDVLFHDGKPLTSADVAFSLEMAKKNHPSGEPALGPVEKVETPDPYTVVFKLKHPSPVTLIASHPFFLPILPKHIYGEGEIRKHPANLKPIGSGPFKFVEWKKGQYIILERFDNFFRRGRPYLDRIIIEFIPDLPARTIALETGAAHFFARGVMNFADIRRFEKIPHLAVITKGNEAVGPRAMIDFNLRKAPLNNIKVRKAIAHTINREFLIEDMSGYAKPSTAHLRYTSRFYNPNVRKYEYDLNKANQLLDEAGFNRGADGTRFNLSIDFYPGHLSQCESLKEELNKVGIRATLRPPPDFATWVRRTSDWDYEINYNPISDHIDPTIGLDRKFTSRNIKKIPWTNTSGYSNPEVDRLCDEARTELNFEKRKKLYHRVQEILADELPCIYTLDTEWPTIRNKEFDGFPTDIWGAVNPLDTVFWRKGKVGQ
jgi:peptide/nickel transport system substrate-binding protein